MSDSLPAWLEEQFRREDEAGRQRAAEEKAIADKWKASPVGDDRLINILPSTEVLSGAPLLPGFPAGAQFQKIRGDDQLLNPEFRLDTATPGLDALRSKLLGPGNLTGTDQALSNLDAQLMRQGSQDAKSIAVARNQRLGLQGGTLGALNAQGADFQGINQGIQNQFGQSTNILGKDLGTRGQSLLQLPGQENAGVGAQQFNISQALSERDRETKAQLRDFDTRVKVNAAVGQSDAIKGSGGNGLLGIGFLGL